MNEINTALYRLTNHKIVDIDDPMSTEYLGTMKTRDLTVAVPAVQDAKVADSCKELIKEVSAAVSSINVLYRILRTDRLHGCQFDLVVHFDLKFLEVFMTNLQAFWRAYPNILMLILPRTPLQDKLLERTVAVVISVLILHDLFTAENDKIEFAC